MKNSSDCAHTSFLLVNWHNCVLTGRSGCSHQTTGVKLCSGYERPPPFVAPCPLTETVARSPEHEGLPAGQEAVSECVYEHL